MSIEGRVAVVTGAASGIGRAIAHGLAVDGATVAVLDINMDEARETVASIMRGGGSAKAFEVDISDAQSVERCVGQVKESLGAAYALVNNAGWDVVQPFIENDHDFMAKVVGINFLGPVHLTQAFLRGMVDIPRAGRIVNVASDAGRVGSTGEAVYAGAKGGLIAFTKSLAREMARYQITVNCVCPGPTDTPLFQRQPEKIKEALIRAIPFRRLGQPEDVAHAVRFFVSDHAGYITGQTLSVSGGMTMAG